MTYDHWKTTDPADEQLGSSMGSRMIPRSTRLQCAADDAAVIAETIETLDTLLDHFWKAHGDNLSADLCVLMRPDGLQHEKLKRLAKKVYAFAHSLEPTED